MTVQVKDTMELKISGYELGFIDGQLDFKPQEYGIVPVPPNTACWRGYYCKYSISRKGIFLEQLNVCSQSGEYPVINGVTAVAASDGTHVYKNLRIQMDFTGSIYGSKKTLLKSRKTEKEFVYKSGQLVEVIG